MTRVAILTGDEMRHRYFRKKMSNDDRFEVVGSICEGADWSLDARVRADVRSSDIERFHVEARIQSEIDFFSESIFLLEDKSNPIQIKKGDVNSPANVKILLDLKPDILVCYGSSIINSDLLQFFEGRFLNVHLGLSPYYRGSGTNVWPLINEEPFMVGATFMHLDAGIDTGKIIHQIRPDIFLGDSPHSIGNRLIRTMSEVYADIIANFEELADEEQPEDRGVFYRNIDFDASACSKLYGNFRNGMIEHFLTGKYGITLPYIVSNGRLVQAS